MRTHRTRRIDRTTAERLLAGEVTASEAGPLGAHLAALAAPARPEEIAGEPEAVEAFRAGFQARGRQARRRRGSLARLLTVKVAIVTFVSATTVGGVALAASTSVLPAPFRPPAKVKPTPPRPAPEIGRDTRPHEQSKPAPAATPSLAELCRAYRPGPGNPPPRPLVNAAGDRAKVADFCRKLVGAKPGPAGGSAPGTPAATEAPPPPPAKDGGPGPGKDSGGPAPAPPPGEP